MSISQIHYNRANEACNSARRAGIIGAKIEKRGMYFYIVEGTYGEGKHVSSPYDTSNFDRVATVAEKPAFARPENADGLCARIRAFSIANPHATVEDAREAFPDANKSTVQIQFKKARK